MTLRSTAPPLWGTVLSQSMRRFPLNKECQTHYKIAVVLRISDSLLNCCSFVIWHWLITLLSPCEIFLSISLDIYVCAKSLSRVWLLVIPWTVACQAPLFMGFSRQEYWSGLPCPPPGELPDLGIEPKSHVSCTGKWVLDLNYHVCCHKVSYFFF